MIVTQIQKRRGRQVLLELDGQPGVTVDARTWEESPYRVGSSLSEEALSQLLVLSQRNRAREKALYLLSLRDYSRKELEEKLCREKGQYHAEREEAAAQTARHMEELGLVNDSAYAARLAVDLQRRKCYPRRRAQQEMQERGIDRDTARQALEELDADDGQLALELLRKKYYNKLHAAGPENIQKVMAALARYGFGYEDIRRAVSAVLAEQEESLPTEPDSP